MRMAVVTAFFLLAAMLPAAAQDTDSHAGYYYPEPQTREIYVSELPVLADVSERTRVGFTVGLNARQQRRPYAPRYHLFAKGAHAQKLIITATSPNYYDTLFRMRALLAAMTADARTSPMFRDMASPEDINFFDLAKIIGFTQITVTDGDKFAHRIILR